MRTIRIVVYSGVLLVLLWIMLSLRSMDLTKTLGGVFDQSRNTRKTTDIAVSVEKLREEHELDGEPVEEGWKYVRLYVTIGSKEEVKKLILGQRNFQLVDATQTKHLALASSPLFMAPGSEFPLEPGGEIRGEMVFKIPRMAKASHLHFRK
ncbi:MAG: hypothetical protein V1800_14520 [Candidatus Latescibacterota bacterium]